MRTIYVLGSKTQVHSDYIIGHYHTLLKVNSGNSTLLHQDVQDIHIVINITLSLQLSKCGKASVSDKAFTGS
jgi:pentose-5-phosphate-3-epimerase